MAAPTTEPTTTPAQRPQQSPSLGRELMRVFGWRVIIAIVLFIVLALIFQAQSNGVFLSSRNISQLLRQASVVAIAAGGVAVLMIMSEIDLSTGSAVYLVGVAAATAQMALGGNLGITLLIAVAVGVLLGAWNGLWVAAVGVPSFIVTLAGLLVFRGIGLLITNARTISPLGNDYVDLSEAFINPTQTLIGGLAILVILIAVMVAGANADRRRGDDPNWPRIVVRAVFAALIIAMFVYAVSGFLGTPTSVLWVIVATAVLTFVMARTVFGRNAYMIGANRAAAVQAGVAVKRNIFYGFLLMGVVYGVCGILFTARLNASTPSDGINLELDAIAAAVIGGIALSGGVGRVPAVIVGALLLSMIDNGMSVTGVSSFAQDVVKGLILLLAVAADGLTRKGKVRLPGTLSTRLLPRRRGTPAPTA